MPSTDLEMALEDMRRENEELRGQIAAAVLPVPNALVDPPHSSGGLDAYWRAMYDNAAKQRDEMADLNLRLEQKADEREAKLKQRDEDLAVLTEEIRRRDEIIATNELLASELFDLRDTLTHRDGDLAYKDRVIAETRDAVASLTEKLRIAESDINLLKAVRDKAYDEIGALNVRLAEVDAQRLEVLPPDVSDLQRRLGLETELVGRLSLQLDSLRKAYDNAIFKLDSNGLTIPDDVQPTNALEMTVSVNRALRSRIDDTEKRLDEAETLASDLDAALAKANNEIASLARQLDEAKTTLGQAGTALERAMQPMIELVDVSRNGQHWVEVRVSLDDGQTTRLAALIDEAGWHGYLRLYPEHLGLADAPADANSASREAA